MSQHSLPPPEFTQDSPLANPRLKRLRPSAGQQAEATEAYATAALRVLRQAHRRPHPSQDSSDDE